MTAIDGITSLNGRGETGVWTIRACSPALRLDKLATASPTEMYKVVRPGNVLQGGAGAPFISRDRLRLFPYVKGPAGEGVRYQELVGSEILTSAIIGAGLGFGSTVTIGVASCLAGLIPTGGVSCLAIPAAAIAGIVGAISGVLERVFNNHLDRVITMGSSDWDFHVPNGWKGWIVWNGFGTIGHNFVDPSFSNLWVGGETPPFRMWAWFSAYPVAQGPNPDARGVRRGLGEDAGAGGPIGAEDVDPHNLRTLRGEITRGGPDAVIEVSAAGERIEGGLGEDVLVGRGPRSRLAGGRGEDVLALAGRNGSLHGGLAEDAMVAAARGARLHGGRQEDTLVAARLGARLNGGPGDDTLVSERGGTTVVDRQGDNRIVVMNDSSTDTVICGRGQDDIVLADRRDRVARSCEYVFVDGRGAPPSPAKVGEPGYTGSHAGTRRP